MSQTRHVLTALLVSCLFVNNAEAVMLVPCTTLSSAELSEGRPCKWPVGDLSIVERTNSTALNTTIAPRALPEPGTLSLLGLTLVGLAITHRRKP
jgi:hypothetical protein